MVTIKVATGARDCFLRPRANFTPQQPTSRNVGKTDANIRCVISQKRKGRSLVSYFVLIRSMQGINVGYMLRGKCTVAFYGGELEIAASDKYLLFEIWDFQGGGSSFMDEFTC